jgi:hypothetical protein
LNTGSGMGVLVDERWSISRELLPPPDSVSLHRGAQR